MKLIKISQKKTCNGCKALNMSQYTHNCLLGYKCEKFINLKSIIEPQIPCPKPCNYNDLIECQKQYTFRQIGDLSK